MSAARDTSIDNIRTRLLVSPEVVDDVARLTSDWAPPVPHQRPPVEAAVLIALVERGSGLHVLYTERSHGLRSHSGQIAFPGGKVDPEDGHVSVAALREAEEEVAMFRDDAEVLGYLPSYFTGSNYLITPVVAVVNPREQFRPNPHEVASLFEVPLDLLRRPESYGTYRIKRGTHEHSTWQILYGGHTIWGITANLTRRFYELALASAAA